MTSTLHLKQYLFSLSVILGLLLTIWLRIPFINEGSPYFYREDEAHHFNRLANMMKTGDLDPHYFHKPSLHFYLRLPVLAGSFLWSVKKGEIRTTKEIVTQDPFGVGDYAFSASHPRLVKANRAFSVLLQLGSIFLTYLICIRLVNSRWIALFAAALFALSPAAISESAVIGVDVVMTFFCLAAVFLGLRAFELGTGWALALCSLCAGLAVSSKYNALPIVLVPLLVFILQRPWRLERGLIAIFLPWLFFLAASPFILISIPEFLNQLAYEVWHYGVAGHVGHMAEPGLSQVSFYSGWLAYEGLGLIAASFALMGLIFFIPQLKKPFPVIALIFPTLFFILMAAQKTNFERNMTVVIPFAAIFAAISIFQFRQRLAPRLLIILAFMALIQPLLLSLELRANTRGLPESRNLASEKIYSLLSFGKEVAIDGKLQFPRKLLEADGVSRADFVNASPIRAYQDGFNYLIVPTKIKSALLEGGYFKEDLEIPGIHESQRIVQNPAITILKRNSDLTTTEIMALASKESPFELIFKGTPSEISYKDEPEGHRWINITEQPLIIRNASAASHLHLEVFTPWPNQIVSLILGGEIYHFNLTGKNLSTLSIPLQGGSHEQTIVIKTSRVHSPKALGISSDGRRLGIAIKSASLS